jgi:putative flippase GtrA
MTLTSLTPAQSAPASTPAGAAPVLDIVIPVHNEATELERSVRHLHRYLATTFPYTFQITIADNASTDATLPIAQRLADELPGVNAVHVAEKGRGLAVRTVWSRSASPVLCYMDVDMSTDLSALLPLVAPLISGHSDVAIGTRFARGSRVVRGLKRETISRGYNLLLKCTLGARFSDAQCGFKAIRADVAARLLSLIADTSWFFDTELLVIAQRARLRIHEVPVDWVDDPDSRVQIIPTAISDLRGIFRVSRTLAAGALPVAALRERFGRRPQRRTPGLRRQVASFLAIGVVSTLAYLALFALLRSGMTAQPANALALLLTAIGNTAANRRLTFGITGRAHAARHQLQGLFVVGLGLALTGGSLAVLHAIAPTATRTAELYVVVVANLAATATRFVLLRLWMLHHRAA